MNKERRWRISVEDMIEAISRIESYVAGFTREGFLSDQRTIDAVIRNLEILGEAVSHIPMRIKRDFSAVPWENLRRMRNFLAHEYFSVDNSVVWETVSHELRSLKPALARVLDATRHSDHPTKPMGHKPHDPAD